MLNFKSKVNAMTLAYAAHLGLKVRMTNVGAQKIDGSLLATYSIVIAAFQVDNKLGRSWFFQETFLLAGISMEVVLGILFLFLVMLTYNLLRKNSPGKPTLPKKLLQPLAKSKSLIKKNLLRWR